MAAECLCPTRPCRACRKGSHAQTCPAARRSRYTRHSPRRAPDSKESRGWTTDQRDPRRWFGRRCGYRHSRCIERPSASLFWIGHCFSDHWSDSVPRRVVLPESGSPLPAFQRFACYTSGLFPARDAGARRFRCWSVPAPAVAGSQVRAFSNWFGWSSSPPILPTNVWWQPPGMEYILTITKGWQSLCKWLSP